MPTIIGTAASELLEGGQDADYIRDEAGGSDILRGNGGNDTLIVYRQHNSPAGTIRMEGGDGDDSLSYRGYNASDVIMDGGSGADRFLLQNAGGGVSITTGSGVDTIELDQGYTNSAGQFTPPIVVTDFSTGAGGDRLDWSSFLALHLYSWNGSNPFALGHARLLQSGGDTLLQFDSNGGGTAYVTLAIFQNTTAASFTAENLGGFPPDGSAVPGQIITGTAGDETLNGTGGNDVISGFDGNDTIYGGAGDDQIEGGAGADTLYGGVGSDIVSGGDGNDVLADRENGSDILRGNGGNDTLTVSRRGQMVDAIIRMEGGDGDDILSYESLSSGAERIEVIMDGGSGADRLLILGSHGTLSITTGSGVDTIEIYQGQVDRHGQMTPIVVTDFSTGTGGDRLDWSRYLSLSNWDGGNPFASGHARLFQSGADTLLQFDRYGGSNANITFVTFRNTTATSFTAENLGGFLPEVGQIITGTASAETLNGTGGNDVINGLGGHDTINGGAGDDQIDGGAGNDTIRGGLGSDTVSGGAGDDTITDYEGGSDILRGGDGNDYLEVVRSGNITAGTIRMEGGDGDDILRFQGHIASDVTMDGGSGSDSFRVLDANGTVTITTGSGADAISLDHGYANEGGHTILVTDFSTGEGGDRVDLLGFLSPNLSNWNGSNPFTSGHVRLLQSGADSLLQIDRDGGGNNYTTLLIFQSTTAANFNTFNLSGLAPNGTPMPGETITGTAGNDTLAGTSGDDLINGLSGHDTINGGAGNDQIDGGDGDDRLDGGPGSDIVNGGVGNDEIVDHSGGSDILRGGDGNDYLEVVRFGSMTAGTIRIEGGDGDDILRLQDSGASDVILDGGAGDDVISGGPGHHRIDGGTGWDIVTVSGSASAYRILADGDNFILKGPDGGDRLTNVEAIRFGDGRILDLARMYGPDVDERAWGDGRIPEALLSGGAWNDDRPLVLPGPAGDDALIAKDVVEPEVLPEADEGVSWVWKDDDAPLVLPEAEDVFVLNAKAFDGPEVLPGVDDWTLAGAKGFDLFEVLPGPGGLTLALLDQAALLDQGSGQMLTVDEHGHLEGHYVCGGGWRPDGWSF